MVARMVARTVARTVARWPIVFLVFLVPSWGPPHPGPRMVSFQIKFVNKWVVFGPASFLGNLGSPGCDRVPVPSVGDTVSQFSQLVRLVSLVSQVSMSA